MLSRATDISSYLAFVVDGIKPNGRELSSNVYCRALSITSLVKTSSLQNNCAQHLIKNPNQSVYCRALSITSLVKTSSLHNNCAEHLIKNLNQLDEIKCTTAKCRWGHKNNFMRKQYYIHMKTTSQRWERLKSISANFEHTSHGKILVKLQLQYSLGWLS
jgi:hypothetical protein